jgi:hypothetical protein
VTAHPPLLVTHRKVVTLTMLDLHLALQADPGSADTLAAIARIRESLDRLQAAIWAERDKAHAAASAADVGYWTDPMTGTLYCVQRAQWGIELHADRWDPEDEVWDPCDVDLVNMDTFRRLTGAELEQRLARLGVDA